MWQDDSQQRAPLLEKTQSSSSEYGQKYDHDPEFKGVKESGRKCNDLIFAILFLVAIGGMIAVSVLAFSRGNPSVLIPSYQWSDDVENRAQYWFQDAVAILKQDSYVIAGALGLALVLAALWLQALKIFTKIFIYLTLCIGILAVIGTGGYFLGVGMKNNNQAMRITSYVIFGVAAVLILIVIFLRKKIQLTAALFAECCKSLEQSPAVFLIAFIVFAMLGCFVIYWVTQFVFLYSIPGTSVNFQEGIPIQFNTKIRNLMYYQVFVFFWVVAFLSAVFQLTVAGAVATWYFSRDINGYRANMGSPAFRSFRRALTFSFGSLAFGSLLLAVVQFINFVLNQTKRANRTNKIIVFIISCIQCLLSCVQRVIKFVDRFAYIYIAMHGDSFCTSARNCFNLVSRNLFSAVVVDYLGEFVLFVGKLLGTALSTVFLVFVNQMLHRPISPVSVTLTAFISYRIFAIFADILSVGVDTIFVCYLEDLERNKDGALYMSPELHRMLQDKASKVNSKRINN